MSASRFRRLIALLLAAGAAAGAASSPPAPLSVSRPDDLWPQATHFPDPARLRLTALPDGTLAVEGLPGAALGASPVIAVSPNNGAAARTISAGDGSFRTRLSAVPGAWVSVRHDPTASFGYPRWLPPFGVTVADFMEDHANIAPGTWLLSPAPAPAAGEGTAFSLADEFPAGRLDFRLDGRLSGDLRPGGTARLEGRVSVFPSTAGARALAGRRLAFDLQLGPLFNAAGRPRLGTNVLFSNFFTPTGLPVQHPGFQPRAAPRFSTGTLGPGAAGSFTAPFRWEVRLPATAPAGTYVLWLRPDPAEAAPGRSGPRGQRFRFLTQGMRALPPFRLGKPAPPRLVWTLLTDVPSADGTRGAVAAQDAADFQLAPQVALQSPRFIVPRLSKDTRKPLVYRLEPYLPMLTTGDRNVPYPPTPELRLPSGSLEARVTRPDGKVDVLGPAPFRSLRNRGPSSRRGYLLDNGGTNLVGVPQLSTETGLFDYAFPLYGEYSIELNGRVEDVHGNAYEGGGTYTVFAAEPLDLEPAVLPMTPFQAGNAFHPGVNVLPGVPADVEVTVTHLPESDASRAERRVARGRANRFGHFAPPQGAPAIVFDDHGEFRVDAVARYTGPDGTLWMGAFRWGQVVETPGAPLLARGRRGRDDVRLPLLEKPLWFESPVNPDDPTHIQFPYAAGDVAWHTRDGASIAAITVQDREGAVERAMRTRHAAGDYYRSDYLWDYPFEERARAGELPLTSVAKDRAAPPLAPDRIETHAYWYAGVERPGERVREVVADDRGLMGRGYWHFKELYELQPGMGAEGDAPNDFKFQFGGAVFRDAGRGLARYGIYASLFVILPDGDARGSRVFPPFRGANGGPDGGPLLTLAGRDVEAFVVPLAVRPGTVLETGDAFSFSAQLAPTLPGRVEYRIDGPRGFSKTVLGRANAVGYYYDPAQDFRVAEPGLYRVTVAATFDGATSAGPLDPPYPTGTVLGAADGTFDVYVLPRGSRRLDTLLKPWSAVPGAGPVSLVVDAPVRGTLRYTVAMPGFQLESGARKVGPGSASVSYEPRRLKETFPNLDVALGRAGAGPGLADTVWVAAYLEGEDGGRYARHFTLQGPDLYAP